MIPRLTVLLIALALSTGQAAAQYPSDQKPGPPRETVRLRPVQPAMNLLGPSQYKVPAQEIADLVDAKPTPRASVSPDNRWLLLLEYPILVPLTEVSMRELRLAGIRIRPATSGPSRSLYYTQLTLRSLADSSSA